MQYYDDDDDDDDGVVQAVAQNRCGCYLVCKRLN